MSMRQIAEMTGLSITTVSHALNGTRAVSERSRRMVEAAAKEIGYRPNLAAQMLRRQRSQTVALVVPTTKPGNSTNDVFFDMLSGAKRTLMEAGYDLVIATYSEEDGAKALARVDVLKKDWIDGALVVPADRRQPLPVHFTGAGVPVVLLDRRIVNEDYSCVHCDNRKVVETAVSLFLKKGRRRIGYLGGHLEYSTAHDRFASYKSTLEKAGLVPDKELIRTDADFTAQDGRRITKELVAAGVDAIFATNAPLTLGMLRQLGEDGVSIPDDVAVIGYDIARDWSRICHPTLTAIWQDTYRVGQVGAELLVRLIENKAEALRRNVILPAELVVGTSH